MPTRKDQSINELYDFDLTANKVENVELFRITKYV